MLRAKLPFFLAYARAMKQPIFIDYIESDGNQYILDTLQIKPSHKIVVDGQYIYTGTSYQFVAGSAEADWKNQACIRLHSETTALISAGVSSDLFSINSNQRYLWTLDILNGKGYLDNNEVSSFSGFVPSGSSRWGYIGVLFNDAFYNASVGKTYSIKLYDNEVLIRHLRPCLHPQTFEACMYDTVTKQYFYNQGTGSFIPAPRFVEYIESDGNQYIDTQYIISSENIKLNIKANISTLETMKTLCGSQIDVYNAFGGLIYYDSSYGGLGVCVGTSYNNNTYSPITAGEVYEIEHTANNGTATLTKNGVVTTTTYTGTLKSNNTWYLFWSNGGQSYYKIKAKIYYARLEDNGVVVRDLRPCLRGNTPCMFDVVEGKYYMNAGTGEFKYAEIKFVDYIRSTGTQYIDTGIANWNNTLEFEIKLSIEPQSGIKTYYGNYDGWDTSKNTVPGISTWTNYRMASDFRAGFPSSSGTDIGIINGQTGTISLKGNTISWSEGSSLSFDRGYDFTVPSSIFLFSQHTAEGAVEFATTKIYCAKFWLNGELIGDFRPALDYNNVACMFDMVTGKYFYNQGTGEFIAAA